MLLSNINIKTLTFIMPSAALYQSFCNKTSPFCAELKCVFSKVGHRMFCIFRQSFSIYVSSSRIRVVLFFSLAFCSCFFNNIVKCLNSEFSCAFNSFKSNNLVWFAHHFTYWMYCDCSERVHKSSCVLVGALPRPLQLAAVFLLYLLRPALICPRYVRVWIMHLCIQTSLQ